MTGPGENGEEKRAAVEDRDADFSQLEGAQADIDAVADGGGAESHGSKETIQAIDPSGDPGLRQELDQTREKYLRAIAELDNVRKRYQRERSELLKYQGERVFVDLLEVVDNFERALESQEGENFRQGIELIYQMLTTTLQKWEVKAQPAKGEPFDPNRHSAISRVPVEDAEPGTVVEELKKAYFYKDKLIRPAEVVVAAKPEGPPQPEVQDEAEPDSDSEEPEGLEEKS